jgi:hypothetical protein
VAGGGEYVRKSFVIWLALATMSITFAAPSVFAEPICLDRSFALVSTTNAAVPAEDVASVDANQDGYVCQSETTDADGTMTLEFMDDVQTSSTNYACPPVFVAYTGKMGPIDRNGNGLVCQKVVNCDMMSKNCKVIVVDDHPAPP